MIAVSVLGSVELHRDGEHVPVRAGKTTEVLIRLALEAGVMVRTERLIEDLWVSEAPGTARNTLQTKVSRLRRALGDPALVTGTSAGYTLNVDPGAVDALEVLRLAEQASALRTAGDAAASLSTSSTALAMFAGEILVDGGDGDWLIPHRVRLEEARLGLLEDHLAVRMELGATGEVVAELEGLVAEHPLREGLWALLMIALYRDGRQADALAAYTRVRDHLAEELGLDPGPALQAVEQQVLLQDPSLDLRNVADAGHVPAGQGNVPSLSSAMIGRDSDLAAVHRAAAEHRLVTIVGPAGVGKTRLAIEAARQADRAGGSWLVRLDSARDASSVLHTIAETLGVARATEPDVIDHLRLLDVLLTLDNCEQVVDEVAELVARFLDRAPLLRVLCTSQLPLGLDGEVIHALEPLAITDSMQLFTQRAVAQRKSFVLDGDAEKTVEEVCRSLDGLPLAIELAAARAKTLSVDEIARRLQDRFTLLADPTSRRPERRRALGAAIAWSYDLLFPDDQRGLWALACFSDGAPLPAVEHVLGALDVPGASAVDVVGRLADRSLVTIEDLGGAIRYRLLDSIRAFALDRLHEAGLADVAHRAHAVWFADAAANAAEGARGPNQASHLALTRNERANIDAALGWAELHDPGLGLRIANGFGWAWFLNGDGPLGTERLRRALHAADDVATAAERAMNLYTTAWLDASSDIDRAHADATQAMTIADSVGDEYLHALSRAALAFVLLNQARPAEALSVIDGCAAIQHRLGRRWDEGAAWILTAHAALPVGDLTLAGRACHEAEPLVRDLGDDWTVDHLDAVLGRLAQAEHRFPDAATHLRRAAEACGRLGFRATEANHRATLGRILQQAGDYSDAIASLEQAIEIGRTTRDMRVIALARVRLGQIRRAQGDLEAAKTTMHAADHWFRKSGGGDGAALAACIAAAMDAEHGAPDVAQRLGDVLETARSSDDLEVQVLALDALAALRATEGDVSAARDLLERSDKLAPTAGHRLVDSERLDATRARSLLDASVTATAT